MIRYGKYGRKYWKDMKKLVEMWNDMENTEENCEMIWKIWKKGKSNSEKIWKIQKKILKRYEKYVRKVF